MFIFHKFKIRISNQLKRISNIKMINKAYKLFYEYQLK